MILECLRYNFEKVQKQKLNLRKKRCYGISNIQRDGGVVLVEETRK